MIINEVIEINIKKILVSLFSMLIIFVIVFFLVYNINLQNEEKLNWNTPINAMDELLKEERLQLK